MSSTNKQIILIALSILLVVLFLFMPEQPLSVREDIKSVSSEMNNSSEDMAELDVETRIKNAIAKVQGAAPMAGILELKAIADEDPSQIDAQYILGVSSVQTGQFEKAVERFKKVITFAGLKKYPETRFNLAISLEELGRVDEAIEQLELMDSELEDGEEEKRSAIQEQLSRLRN